MPGTLSLEDGRFLDRQADGQRVMVIETEGGLPPARRKRRRPKKAGPEEKAASVPVTIVTAIRSQAPFDAEREAVAWLSGVEDDPELVDPLLDEAENLLDRALGADAAASGVPYTGPPSFRNDLLAAKIGIADGDRVASEAGISGPSTSTPAAGTTPGAAGPKGPGHWSGSRRSSVARTKPTHVSS